MTTITLQRDLLAERRAAAEAFRQELTARQIFCINLISSPGAGKTALLQAVAQHWAGRVSCVVLTGDIATDRDAERLAPFVPVRQLTTGGACHLELSLVQKGWQVMPQAGVQFLFIENVGNLVCPSSHDLGEHLRLVVLSVTEGDDKPGKYPKAFRTSQACVINKSDLLPYVPFSASRAIADARQVQPDLPVFVTSAIRGEGVAELCAYFESLRQKRFLSSHTE